MFGEVRRTEISTGRPGESRRKKREGGRTKFVKGGEEIRINREFSLKAEERREEKRGERTEWWFGLGVVRRKETEFV